MDSFIEEISCGTPYDPGRVVGYSADELAKIERFYDIVVRGDFRRFLLEMGRSDGGLIGDDPIILYRNAWPVRTQFIFQYGFYYMMQENENFDYLLHKPFVFSWEGESLYDFVMTTADQPYQVYSFDENTGEVRDLDICFVDYLKYKAKYSDGKSGVICRGEILDILEGDRLLCPDAPRTDVSDCGSAQDPWL